MQNGYVYKAYMTQYTLGLIGAILTAHGTFFSFAGFETNVEDLAIINVSLLIIATILSFIGTTQLNKNLRRGGILLSLAGGLNVLALIFTGISMSLLDTYYELSEVFVLNLVYTLACAALLLTGGIMTLAKKREVAPPPLGWTYPVQYPGYYPPTQVFPPAVVMPEAIVPPPAFPDSAKPPHSGYTHQPYAPSTMPPRNP